MELCNNPARSEWARLCLRAGQGDPAVEQRVRAIIDRVKSRGDEAIRELALEIDGVALSNLKVPTDEFAEAEALVSDSVKASIRQAYDNIFAFHKAQMPKRIELETAPGVRCVQKPVAIPRVGLYIPGGTAPLFSTVLMLAVPSLVAGCRTRILCTPCGKDGRVCPEVLYAASYCGIKDVYKAGGAQAVAAMAYGTESIPSVDKIFGPGNRYVTTAKQLVSFDGTAIDMPAGPSEVMVLADGSANPAFVAADLLSQAEHGRDSQAVLVCNDACFAEKVLKEVERQAALLPRGELIASSLGHSRAVVFDDPATMMEFADFYAPEHLIISMDNAESIAEQIQCAGSVFVGQFSPESAGDYASGTNHTLPTSGWARSYSGVNVDSFMRKMTLQNLSAAGLKGLAGCITAMAEAEGLEAHANAVRVRLAAAMASKGSGFGAFDIGGDGALAASSSDRRAAALASKGSGFGAFDIWGDGTSAGSSSDRLAAAEPRSVEFELERVVRPNILSLCPYSTARDDYQGELGVFLDANENPFENGFNRYPDPHQKALKARICQLKGFRPENLFLGNGSDEAIDLIYRVFCEPGRDNVVAISPSYGMYSVAAATNDIEYRKVQLDENFQLDTAALLDACDPFTKAIFLCSPNNPSGNALPMEQILSIARSFRGVVVVDEAYVDFSDKGSAVLAEPNIIVLQTLSKAWGMAGLRIGLAIADERIIRIMSMVKYPYNISKAAMQQAMELLAQPVDDKVRTLRSERDRLSEVLPGIAAVRQIWPSDANFILARFDDANDVYGKLIAAGIIVRNRSSVPGCSGCLRITVGTPEENDRLIQTLQNL